MVGYIKPILGDRQISSIWIFPNLTKPELPLSPNSAYTHLKAILKKAGLPDVRFHDIRHTFATLVLQNGMDIKTVSGMLGHYDAGFTLRTYTHATDRMQEQAAATMGNLISRSM